MQRLRVSGELAGTITNSSFSFRGFNSVTTILNMPEPFGSDQMAFRAFTSAGDLQHCPWGEFKCRCLFPAALPLFATGLGVLGLLAWHESGRLSTQPPKGSRQSVEPAHRCERKLSVKMREQRTAARRLPLQLVAESIGIDGDQNEVALTGKPLGCGFRRLLRRSFLNEMLCLGAVGSFSSRVSIPRQPAPGLLGSSSWDSAHPSHPDANS